MIKEYSNNNKKVLNKIYKIIISNLLIIYPTKSKEEFDNQKNYHKWINSITSDTNYKIIAYEEQQEILGFLSYNTVDNNLWISEVQVKDEYKHIGILKKLLRYFIKKDIINNYQEIYIHINSNNNPSKIVFTHIGFKEKEKTIYRISINDLKEYLKK